MQGQIERRKGILWVEMRVSVNRFTRVSIIKRQFPMNWYTSAKETPFRVSIAATNQLIILIHVMFCCDGKIENFQVSIETLFKPSLRKKKYNEVEILIFLKRKLNFIWN